MSSDELDENVTLTPIVLGVLIIGFVIFSCCGTSTPGGRMPTISERTTRAQMAAEEKNE
eukprot:CAMPEP_0185358688 /NCGR_PEP_ID=MMETSP1364-20130426/8344_1 /TAXON_ID=38817 /ORGANISM="Gephyrocapsa oceanica, Strain RCC1303" /LENGTH=58 /DNA_ID=CAMNT_0027958811 /DNA_START=68 /DNA_END=244 /DNA_ORIENTATION=-